MVSIKGGGTRRQISLLSSLHLDASQYQGSSPVNGGSLGNFCSEMVTRMTLQFSKIYCHLNSAMILTQKIISVISIYHHISGHESSSSAVRPRQIFSPRGQPFLVVVVVVVIWLCSPPTWERGLLGDATLRRQPGCFRLCHERHAHAR